MSRPALEVADIFRNHGAAWRDANRGHVSLGQLKVMSAIESCRTAALGGHVARCQNDACGHTVIAYNSCRNRHCPKCQGSAAREWLAEREAELLPVPYFHVVFSLPAEIGDIAYQNKAAVYDLLFKISAETMLAIAADPEHLGAKIAITSVLHTWGSAMMHHPHVHMIVPGGGLSPDGARWIATGPKFLLPVLVLSALFRRRMLEALALAHKAGKLVFFGEFAHLANATTFANYLEPLEEKKWHVYAKRPFAGPKAVLAYLARYTHRVAISSRRLIKADDRSVTFKYKDYRIDGPGRYKTMTVHSHEFIRRFLIHVLPKGLHRIRHYGLLANGSREENLAKARALLNVPEPQTVSAKEEAATADADQPEAAAWPCPCCGARMLIIETFEGVCRPRHHAPPSRAVMSNDTS
ncbi:MAG: IS91 family transposase [Candidatus Dormibacteraeota bacterium]|nr:IS91 family transposase [Candidatus Dormibacteraeota bacterium]